MPQMVDATGATHHGKLSRSRQLECNTRQYVPSRESFLPGSCYLVARKKVCNARPNSHGPFAILIQHEYPCVVSFILHWTNSTCSREFQPTTFSSSSLTTAQVSLVDFCRSICHIPDISSLLDFRVDEAALLDDHVWISTHLLLTAQRCLKHEIVQLDVHHCRIWHHMPRQQRFPGSPAGRSPGEAPESRQETPLAGVSVPKILSLARST